MPLITSQINPYKAPVGSMLDQNESIGMGHGDLTSNDGHHMETQAVCGVSTEPKMASDAYPDNLDFPWLAGSLLGCESLAPYMEDPSSSASSYTSSSEVSVASNAVWTPRRLDSPASTLAAARKDLVSRLPWERSASLLSSIPTRANTRPKAISNGLGYSISACRSAFELDRSDEEEKDLPYHLSWSPSPSALSQVDTIVTFEEAIQEAVEDGLDVDGLPNPGLAWSTSEDALGSAPRRGLMARLFGNSSLAKSSKSLFAKTRKLCTAPTAL